MNILVYLLEKYFPVRKFRIITIEMEADFIQLRGTVDTEFVVYTDMFRKNGVRINYFGTDDPDLIQILFELGIDFPFVDDIVNSIEIASELGIKPVIPVY